MRGLKVIAFVITLWACAFAESAWALYGAISAPESGATFTANANITITADAFPGTYLVPIVKVEFFAGEMLIGTDTSDPYGITWNNVSAGTYTLTAKVTDTDGNIDVSDEVLITVTVGTSGGAQIYYIVPDHLNTPRLIENQDPNAVWRRDQGEPFGNDVPNNNPSGAGAFDFNLRFPGQYFDRETNLSYNYFRDYDPGTGRYMRSDPIGIRGDLNTYAYVKGSPLSLADPTGLKQLPDSPWEILGRIAKPCEVITSARQALNAIELASYEKYQKDLTDLANFRQLGEEGCIRVDNANPNPCEFGKCLERVNKSYLEGKQARDKSYQEYRTQLYEDPRFLERLLNALASLCSPSTVYGPTK